VRAAEAIAVMDGAARGLRMHRCGAAGARVR